MIIKCKICGGKGFTGTGDVFGGVFGQDRKPCSSCKGAGEFDLNVTEEKLSPCKFCSGRGLIVSASSPLFGTSARICPTCKGLGVLERPQIGSGKSKSEASPSSPDERAKNGNVSELNSLIVPVLSGFSAKQTSLNITPALSEPANSPLQTPAGRAPSSIANEYPVIVLVTVNGNETHALLDAFLGEGKTPAHKTIGGVTYSDLGTHGGHRLVNTVCEMGAGGVGASQQRTRQAIEHFRPKAIIAVGIAFGLDETKQGIGDVLVSTQIQDYELGRLSSDGTLTPRGDKPSSADILLNRLRQTDTSALRCHRDWPKVRFGLVLSGQKLIDNLNYRESLKALFTEAIGGEMEGTGLYVSASEAKVDWIVVKAICDWGHNKNQTDKDAWQQVAAKNAARVIKTALDVGSLYSSEDESPEGASSKSTIDASGNISSQINAQTLKEILLSYFEAGQKNSHGSFYQTKEMLLQANLIESKDFDIIPKLLMDLVRDGFLEYNNGSYYLAGHSPKF